MEVGISRSLISSWFVCMTFNLLAARNQAPKYELLFSAMDPLEGVSLKNSRLPQVPTTFLL